MGGTGESPKVAALMASVDLSARVIYFPVRHHSPGCAWHVGRLIRELTPDAVLIEGPRDATPLIPLLIHPNTRMPVAIYTTYVRRHDNQLPERHAGYYPLCDFSPELEAIRAGLDIGANVRFIDLSFPETIESQDGPSLGEMGKKRKRSASLQDETLLTHSRLLQAACARTGSRDPDDLWDHLYEGNYESLSTAEFMQGVLTYCMLARRGYSEEALAAEGCLSREQAMAAAVAEETGRVIVVTGGFHTVALPTTLPALPPSRSIPVEDRHLVLMRYNFEQLDRLNGYASGMPSPEFYQRQWDGQSAHEILVAIARICRERHLGISTADAIAASAHARALASLRGHARWSREDLLDAVRSVFIKGADDAEGVPVLAIARQFLTGNRVGEVPEEAGLPPIVHDFRFMAHRLKLKLEKPDKTETALDLYRKKNHREISRLFHRLTLLKIPFATFLRGPDFVAGMNLERIQEIWSYRWGPQTESALIENALYGATVEEAAINVLLERFQEAEQTGAERSAAVATQLILHACRMGLHAQTPDLLSRVARLLAEDAGFVSVVTAMEHLLVLEVSREPLEAHHLTGLRELAVAAYHRACFLISTLANTSEPEEALVLNSLNSLVQSARTLGDNPEFRDLRFSALRELVETTEGSAVLRGGAAGMLYGDGQWGIEELVRSLKGHLLSSRDDGADGPNFLRGLLKTARSVFWQADEILQAVNDVLRNWDESRFIKLLPLLRLALSDLTPRETDRVGRRIAALYGTESLQLDSIPDMGSAEMLRAVEINRHVRELMQADGLEAWYAAP